MDEPNITQMIKAQEDMRDQRMMAAYRLNEMGTTYRGVSRRIDDMLNGK